MPTCIIAAQSTDMQYIILFSNTSNREIKRRFRSVDTVVENFACGQCQRSIWKRRQWWEFGNKNNYLQSPIPWFQAGIDLGTASWLVTRLESRCASARSEKRAPLVFGSFSIDMSFTNMVDCNLWCCKQVLNHISCRKWFCSLNGTVTKTRTLAQPSCQVRRLSNFKPACFIYLYSFVCSVTRRIPSFVEDWLCYAHGCTFLALLSMPSPNSLACH